MLTLGALAHYDLNLVGAYSYEQAFAALRRVVNDESAAEELKIRRARDEVRAAIARWPEFAAAAGVDDQSASQIGMQIGHGL